MLPLPRRPIEQPDRGTGHVADARLHPAQPGFPPNVLPFVTRSSRFCNEVDGWKLCNCLEQGETPILPPAQLEEMGFKIAAYPLTLVSSAVKAMEESLRRLRAGDPQQVQLLLKDFAELRDIVGFTQYYEEEERYRSP